MMSSVLRDKQDCIQLGEIQKCMFPDVQGHSESAH